MSLQVVFTRTALGFGDLVIGSSPIGAAFWLPEDGFTEPEFDQRDTMADPSNHVPGALATQSVTNEGTFACLIYVAGADEAALKANKRALEATVRQFRFSTTLTIVGAPDTYASRAGKISWGDVDSGMTRALMARAVVTIPVQPLGV